MLVLQSASFQPIRNPPIDTTQLPRLRWSRVLSVVNGNVALRELRTVQGNYTFRLFVSSPLGPFTHKTFRPLDAFNVSHSNSIHFIFCYY